MFKHILVPTDGSPLSQNTVAQAASFARETGARVTLFFAQPDAQGPYEGLGAIGDTHLATELQERLRAATRDILNDAEQTMHGADVACERLVLVGSKVARLIIQAAEAQGCDLIFMASHGRRGMSALLLGSETQKVLTHSKIPVLVYR